MDKIFGNISESIDHAVNHLMSQNLYGNDLVGITQYSVWLAIALIVMILIVMGAVKRLKMIPQSKLSNAVEAIFEFIRADVVDSVIGEKGRQHLPFIMTIFFYVLINNVLGLLPGGHPGTGTMGVTFGLALISLLYFIVMGIKTHGVFGYLKSLIPAGIMFPINLLIFVIEVFSTLIRVVTLSVRLFANMFAGHIVMGAFAILTSAFLMPVLHEFTLANFATGLPSIIWLLVLTGIYMIETIVAIIQAYVFTILSAVYIQIAIADEH